MNAFFDESFVNYRLGLKVIQHAAFSGKGNINKILILAVQNH